MFEALCHHLNVRHPSPNFAVLLQFVLSQGTAPLQESAKRLGGEERGEKTLVRFHTSVMGETGKSGGQPCELAVNNGTGI